MSKIENIGKNVTDDYLLSVRNILKFTYIHQNGCEIIYSEIWPDIKIDFIEETPDLKEVTTDEEDQQEFNRKNNPDNNYSWSSF